MLHVIITERRRELRWAEILQVVREAVGAAADAVEIYPALRREIHEETRRHLYALVDMEWPLGMVPEREMRRRVAEQGIAQKVFEMLRAHKVLVRFDEAGERAWVYRDIADATSAGLETTVLREALLAACIDQGAAVEWSAAAQEYRDGVIREAEQLKQRLVAEWMETGWNAAGAEVAQPAAPEPAPQEVDPAAEEAAARDLRAMRESMRRDDG